MNRSNGATGVATRSRPSARGAAGHSPLFTAVLTLLFASAWAANHFASLLPAIEETQGLTAANLNAVFGIYALGLLPGLLMGGRASDAFGRPSVALVGSTATLLGTVAMMLSQQSGVLTVGRLVVGTGVGLAVSACTAWASDLKGPAGAALAGAVLIVGFGIGPFASGAIASAGHWGIWASFGLAAGLLIVAMLSVVIALRRSPTTVAERFGAADASDAIVCAAEQGTARALSWAMPLAPWVFISATIAFVIIPTRVHTGLAAPLAAGSAALIANGVSGVSQLIARRRQWGPRVGVVGALLAALGYAAVAAAPANVPLGLGLSLVLLLGCASGLCLREGLIDLEAAAPQHVRGTLTGVFYAMTYVGFGLPLVLTVLGSAGAKSAVLSTLAVLAAAAGLIRAARLRRNSHRWN